MTTEATKAIEIFYSYAHTDEALRNQLDKHLATLRQQGLIIGWHDRRIAAGTEWASEIDTHLKTAHIILLLVSPDFVASPYCYDIEVKQAMQRHERGETRVIPIILRPVDWEGTPFGRLQALPKNAKPVTKWATRDDAFLDIAKGIRTVVEELRALPRTVPLLPEQARTEIKKGTSPSTSQDRRHVDWGEAPENSRFYGRQQELAELKRWIVRDRCQLVALLGIGGIGKTALSIKLAAQIQKQFTYLIWRSLKNSPNIDELLVEWITFLSDQSQLDLSENLEDKLFVLLMYLRKHRCLLMLDNVESILQAGTRAGHYREGYEGYGRLIQYLGETVHQSCLLLTSRERLKEFVPLEGTTGPVRSLLLQGLEEMDSRKVLASQRVLFGTEEAWKALIQHYGGNPLALKLVAEPIQALYGGDITVFLKDGVGLFDDLYMLLNQQFSRLSELEKEIMYWLAIDRDVVTPDDLLQDIVRLSGLSKEILYWLAIEREETSLEEILHDIVRPVSKREVLEELASLRRRTLIEMVHSNFTLQPVIMEYTTEQFIDQVCEELTTGKITLFASHALIKAQAKEHIRHSQIRMILTPVREKLLATFRGKRALEERLSLVVSRLRAKTPLAPGYVGGNSLNLLCNLQRSLSQYDFSRMTINQAHLRDVELHDVNFTQAHFEHTVFMETFGSIFSVAFSPDGRFLAAGSVGGEIRAWQVEENPEMIAMGHTNLVWSVADRTDDWVWSVVFSPDGSMLAGGNDNSTIKMRNASTGECLRILQGHTDRVWSVVFSPDGKTLASASDDQTVRIWDVDTGDILNTLRGHTDRVVSVAFNPNGTLLSSGSEDRTVRVWEVHTGNCLKVLSGHTGVVRSIAFSPNGTRLGSGSEDRTVRVWEVHTGNCLKVLSGHTSIMRSVVFSPDGKTLASASDDQTVRIWDVDTGDMLNTLQGHMNLVWSIAFSPNGALLASGSEDQTLRLWDTHTGQCLRTLQGYTNQIWSVAFHPDGVMLASGSEDRTVKVWNLLTGQLLRSLPGHHNRVRSVSFSPNGVLLASGSEDNAVRLWDTRTGQCLKTLRGHISSVWSVAFHPNSITLASASDDQTIRVWNSTTGRCVTTLQANTPVWSVAFNPDGTLLASGNEDNSVGLWDVSTGQCLRQLQGHAGNVRSVAFSPDGFVLISGSADQTAKLWDISTGACLQTLQGHISFVKTVAYSPNGSTIASGSDDQTIKVWDAHTYHCLNTFQGHTDSVKSVRFSPDGSMLSSGGEDALINVWNVTTGERLKVLRSPRPYERMNITGVTGLNEAQKATLKVLGAIEREDMLS